MANKLRPWLILVIFFGVAILSIGYATSEFRDAGETVVACAGDCTEPRAFLGVPMFESWHEDGRSGTRLQPGVLVPFLLPFAAALAAALVWRPSKRGSGPESPGEDHQDQPGR